MRVHIACLVIAVPTLAHTTVAQGQLCPSSTTWAATEDDGIRYGRADACELLADGADTDDDDELDRCTCLGDLDHNGQRDANDLQTFLTRWGGDTAHGDLDGDGSTGIRDLIQLLKHWGDCD